MPKSILQRLAELGEEVKEGEKEARESETESREIEAAMRKLTRLESETKAAKKELSKEGD